jgi:hypothetical protein
MEVNKQKEISLEEVRNEQICSILSAWTCEEQVCLRKRLCAVSQFVLACVFSHEGPSGSADKAGRKAD